MPLPVSVRPAATELPRWRLATRIAFRFACLYFSLYIVCTQMISGVLQLPGRAVPNLGVRPPMSTVVMWMIRHVIHDNRPLAMVGGSGDKLYDWVLTACLVVLAVVLAIAWSLLDRHHPAYVRLHAWFHLWVRCALGATLIIYGMSKAIPRQMPYPSLLRLLEPYGHFSPMGVLWSSIGASPPYEILTGSVELLAGVLLFVPATQVLGALLAPDARRLAVRSFRAVRPGARRRRKACLPRISLESRSCPPSCSGRAAQSRRSTASG